MLVLTRRLGEEIEFTLKPGAVMPPEAVVRVTVLGFNNTQMRIGIDAPPEISVQRSEVADRIRAGVTREQHAAERERHSRYHRSWQVKR